MSLSSAELAFYRKFEAEIISRLDELKEQVAKGSCADYEDYRFRVGQIRALNDMLFWAKEANREALGLPKEKD